MESSNVYEMLFYDLRKPIPKSCEFSEYEASIFGNNVCKQSCYLCFDQQDIKFQDFMADQKADSHSRSQIKKTVTATFTDQSNLHPTG